MGKFRRIDLKTAGGTLRRSLWSLLALTGRITKHIHCGYALPCGTFCYRKTSYMLIPPPDTTPPSENLNIPDRQMICNNFNINYPAYAKL